ncbi:MAG: type IV pilus modification protein PilV [Dokdonella sp.]
MSSRPAGFSLLEVLIALLIFSLGMLGMAGLLIISVKTNQSAYLRTQASFLAQGMVDRMRANKAALATNAYNGSYAPLTTYTDPCASGAVCSTANVTARDKLIWRQQLGTLLPSATGTITCAGTLLGTAAQTGGTSYDGLCNMTIAWSESSLDRGSDGSGGGSVVAGTATPSTQTFAWVFQP